MAPRHLKTADYRAMRWANGLGVTTELARVPQEGERYRWRISIATVDSDGPFSAFPGYDRVITMLKGDGMELSFGEHHAPVRIARPLEPFSFSGDWKTDCRLLGGVVTDFNVISDRSAGRSDVTILRSAGIARYCPLRGGAQLLYVAEGTIICRIDDREMVVASGESLLRHRGDAELSAEVGPGGGGVVVDLELPAT